MARVLAGLIIGGFRNTASATSYHASEASTKAPKFGRLNVLPALAHLLRSVMTLVLRAATASQYGAVRKCAAEPGGERLWNSP